ncbi:YdcF family protein [Salinicoccus hispanicus]|uniref:YdcF family protein n=1 Tax=Salinicoccus hispanicus TaxID=157225 RepID=A0A6N8U3J9_9STAP|nr:YdcF family protein [Salinicoccus hispanicus]MXQ51005.1 YdcF family protein [Salinicoccus hispanicus]
MKIRIIIIVVCIALMLVVLSLIESFSHNYSDAPVESDLIVMLGGGDEARMQKAAQLYLDGYADQVLITPVVESEESTQSSALAMEYGISEEALILEDEAISTYTNATITIDIMEDRGMDSALIVTSDYHIKRSKYIYDKLNDGSFEFKYISALSEQDGRWHEGSDAFYIWSSEYIKMWVYRMGIYWFSE